MKLLRLSRCLRMLGTMLGTLFATLLLSGCIALLAPSVETEVKHIKAGQYQLDRSHAALLFRASHIGLSTYVGRFNTFDASLNFDPQNMANTELDAVIEIDSLDINNDGLKKDLMGSTWFDQKKYPQAHFTTRSVTPINDAEFEFIGDLNWRGVTQPISLMVTFHGGANNLLTGRYTLGFSATGTFSRAAFGMDAYAAFVGDEIDIETHAEFQKR